MDKTLYREVVAASLEAADSPALSVGQTEAFAPRELGDGQSIEQSLFARAQVDEREGDGPDDHAGQVIDAQVIGVKVHVDEGLNAYNRYLGELNMRDSPKHWGSRWSRGRGGAGKQRETSPPAESVEGQRSELPVGDRHISD
jgi:hypothetical protein